MGDVVLGVVASGFAVAALSLQLIEVAQSLHTFWDSCGKTNSKVERIKSHLSLLQVISCSIIEVCDREPDLQYGSAVIESLEICKKETEKLCDLVSVKNKSTHRASKKWSSLKITLKDKTIDKIESQLSGDLTLLILALQPFYHGLSKKSSRTTNSSDEPSYVKHKIEINAKLSAVETSEFERLFAHHNISRSRTDVGSGILQCYSEGYRIFKIDTNATFLWVLGVFGCPTPQWLRRLSWNHIVRFVYTNASDDLGLLNTPMRKVFKTRLEVLMPLLSFQVQLLRCPLSITSYHLVHCQSEIFTLCLEGNLKGVQLLINKSRMSPFVVNQHGENLLHAVARNAHDALCLYLIDIGVDGAAYDARLLTPLDHLVRKLPPSLGQPNRVVNTIRALVEKSQCQPLLPVTNNAIAYYSGPEEGFAWLFNAEYGQADLEALDSEEWTLLGDAAFVFGWWSQIVTEVSLGWQSLYLLKRGADPHSENSRRRITPLDAFLRGSSAHGISHARKWLQIVAQSGMSVREYALKEQSLHGLEHCLIGTWDHDLYRWLPVKHKVLYAYGEEPDEVVIWVEPYDALGWFGCGKWDLVLLAAPFCGSEATMSRWRIENTAIEELESGEAIEGDGIFDQRQKVRKETGLKITKVGMVGLLIFYLLSIYLLYLYMSRAA